MTLVASNKKEDHISLCDVFHYDMMMLEVLIDVKKILTPCSWTSRFYKFKPKKFLSFIFPDLINSYSNIKLTGVLANNNLR